MRLVLDTKNITTGIKARTKGAVEATKSAAHSAKETYSDTKQNVRDKVTEIDELSEDLLSEQPSSVLDD